MIARAFGVANLSHTAHQMRKDLKVALAQHPLFRAQPKDNFRSAAERSRIVPETRTGDFQSMTAKGNFRRGYHRNSTSLINPRTRAMGSANRSQRSGFIGKLH